MGMKKKKPHEPDLFDAAASRKARDEGMKRVSDKNPTWCACVVEFVRQLPANWIGTGEDIRRSWKGSAPSHPNAWGSVTKVAVARGYLVETGRYIQMVASKSHSRRTPEYRRP